MSRIDVNQLKERKKEQLSWLIKQGSKHERSIENLQRQKDELANEVEKLHASEFDAQSKVAILEARVEEREKEIESLLKSNNEQRASTVQVLESLLETERAARASYTRKAGPSSATVNCSSAE